MKRRRESETDALEQLVKYQRIHHDLPSDCLFSIFQFCGASTLVHTIPLVCKTWYEVTLEERHWKSLCLLEWPVLEMISPAEWRDISWKYLFQYHATYMPPLLHKELSAKIIQLATSMSQQECIDSSVHSVLDKINTVTDRVRLAIDEQNKYDIRKAKLIREYRRTKDISEDEKELIFMKMLRKVEHDQTDDLDTFVIRLRGISGQTVTLNLSIDPGEIICVLEKDHKKETVYFESRNRTLPGKLKQAYRTLGLKHMSLSNLWKILMEPVTGLCEANNEIYTGEYDTACSDIESFEEQMKMEIDDDDYCIEIVDVTDQRAYEEGKKYILRDPTEFLKAPKEYWKDKKFIYELVQKDCGVISKFPDKMKDKELLDVAVKINVEVLRYFSSEIYENDEKIVQLLQEALLTDSSLLANAPKSVTDNKDLMIQVLQRHKQSSLLHSCSTRLQADEDVVSTALSFGSQCLFCISPALFGSEKIQSSIIANIQTESDANTILCNDRFRPLLHYKSFVLGLVKFSPSRTIPLLPQALKNDVEVIREMFKVNPSPSVLNSINRTVVINDSEIQKELKVAAKQYPNLLEYACEETRSDKQFMLDMAEVDNSSLQYASDSIKNDRDFMFNLSVSSSCNCLKYASEELRNDEDFISSIFQHIPKATTWYLFKGSEDNYAGLYSVAGDILCSDKIWPLLKERVFLLKHLASKVYDINVVKSWLEHDVRVFSFLDPSLKSNRDILIYAAEKFVEQKRSTRDLSECLTPELCTDQELLLKIMKVDSYVIDQLPLSLRSNKEFALRAMEEIESGHTLYSKLSSDLKNDREIVLAIAKRQFSFDLVSKITDSLAVEYLEAGGDFKSLLRHFADDRQIVLTALKQQGLSLAHVSNQLKSDKDVVMQAVQSNHYAIQYANSGVKKDLEIIKAVLGKDGACAQFLPTLALLDKDTLIELVENCAKDCHKILDHLSPSLKNDQDLVRIAMAKTAARSLFDPLSGYQNTDFIVSVIQRSDRTMAEKIFDNLNKEMKKNKSVVIAVLQKAGPIAMYKVDSSLRKDPEVAILLKQENGN